MEFYKYIMCYINVFHYLIISWSREENMKSVLTVNLVSLEREKGVIYALSYGL